MPFLAGRRGIPHLYSCISKQVVHFRTGLLGPKLLLPSEWHILQMSSETKPSLLFPTHHLPGVLLCSCVSKKHVTYLFGSMYGPWHGPSAPFGRCLGWELLCSFLLLGSHPHRVSLTGPQRSVALPFLTHRWQYHPNFIPLPPHPPSLDRARASPGRILGESQAVGKPRTMLNSAVGFQAQIWLSLPFVYFSLGHSPCVGRPYIVPGIELGLALRQDKHLRPVLSP